MSSCAGDRGAAGDTVDNNQRAMLPDTEITPISWMATPELGLLLLVRVMASPLLFPVSGRARCVRRPG